MGTGGGTPPTAGVLRGSDLESKLGCEVLREKSPPVTLPPPPPGDKDLEEDYLTNMKQIYEPRNFSKKYFFYKMKL